MDTDYTDMNRACPKDAYPLPNIDRVVDGAFGYNQIRMYAADKEKMTFITEDANFCYRIMPFGLKNESATYQRLMDWILK